MSEPIALLAPLKPVAAEPKLWRNDRFIQDGWQKLDDNEPIPAAGPIILSLKRWLRDGNDVHERTAPTGLAMPVATDLAPIQHALSLVQLISLPFPRFSDGRSYSTARQAWDAGFSGEIRATGDILLDQLPLMLRAGFDTFEITDAATIHALEKRQLPSIGLVYQCGCEPSFQEWRSRRANEVVS